MQRLLANAAAEWRGSDQDDSYLLRGARLDQFDAWMAESDLALTNEEREFLDSSLAERNKREAMEAERVARENMLEQRSRRFLRALVGVFAVAAVVALLLAGFAFNQRDNATARELAASALVSLEEDPERSILLALRSLNLAYTPEGEEVLRQGMMTSRVRLTIPKSAETVRDVSYTPDGKSIIGIEDDGSNSFVMVWDAASGELLRSLSCGRSCVGGIISSDGNLVAAADDDYNIVIVDLAASFESGSPQIRHRLVGHTEAVLLWAGVFSADGTRLATTSWDKTLKVWDLEEGQLLYSVEEPALQWLFVPPSFSPDGALLTTSALLRSVEIGAQIFDAATGELLLALPTDQRWPSFSPDGQRLVTHSLDGSIVLWDVEASLATGIAQELYSFKSRISGFSSGHPISPDGTYLFEDDGSDVVLWRLEEDRATEAMLLSGHGPGFLGFPLRNDFHPDGRHLVTGGSDGIRVWDISSTGEREALAIDAHEDEIRYLALNRDGTHLATASRDGTARLWDARSGERLQEFNGHQARVLDVDFNPDGNRLVTASDDRTARVWDIVTGEELAVLEASDEGYDVGGQYIGVMSARFSPDGRQIITAGADGTVRLWDAQTYEPLQSVIINPRGENEHPRGVTLAIFSPDGSTLAAATDGGDDAIFKVWDIETGDVLLEQVLGPRLFGLDFSPDGRRVAVSSSAIGIGEVWDLETGEQLLSLPLPRATIPEIFFSADGSQLITPANGISFWDATSGELLKTFSVEGSFVLSPDESRLFIGTDDGLVRVFLMDIDEVIALAQSRLTRSFSEAECQQYLHLGECPAE